MNLTTSLAVPASAYSLSYDAATNWATWTFNGEVADGNYTLTLSGAKIKDSSGNLLDGDDNASAGGDHVFSFWHLLGDLDRDRQIGFADLLAVSAEFGIGTTLADGDVNGDGSVGFADLLLVPRSSAQRCPRRARVSGRRGRAVTTQATPTVAPTPAAAVTTVDQARADDGREEDAGDSQAQGSRERAEQPVQLDEDRGREEAKRLAGVGGDASSHLDDQLPRRPAGFLLGVALRRFARASRF